MNRREFGIVVGAALVSGNALANLNKAEVIQSSIGFSSKYLDNYIVLGRVFQLLEATSARKLALSNTEQFHDTSIEIPGLATELGIEMSKYVSIEETFPKKNHHWNYSVSLTEHGKSLGENKWIEVTAFFLDGKCIKVSSEVTDKQ